LTHKTYTLPHEIEKRSFEIIEEELQIQLDEKIKPVVKRVIHTTADFSYAENMVFSENVIDRAIEVIKSGACTIVTDTNMVKAGINKSAIKEFGVTVHCFVSDEDVAADALKNSTTRAVAAVNKGTKEFRNGIFVVGNAPTALIRIYDLIKSGELNPALVVGVPVGFVNVTESKEMITSLNNTPYIVANGRKGGSNVAAAIINAIMYMARN